MNTWKVDPKQIDPSSVDGKRCKLAESESYVSQAKQEQ